MPARPFCRWWQVVVMLAGLAVVSPLPLASQQVDTTATTTAVVDDDDEEDSDFPWGLLGLLGLAGLIPRRRKEEVHVHTPRPAPPRNDPLDPPPPPRV